MRTFNLYSLSTLHTRIGTVSVNEAGFIKQINFEMDFVEDNTIEFYSINPKNHISKTNPSFSSLQGFYMEECEYE